jgi:Ran GTPase-activating protein (RanGAP) involved in mRNA processing and transport
MSVSSDSVDSTIQSIYDATALRASTFLEFCAKVRTNDPSILPEPGQPFKISPLSDEEEIVVAGALLENTTVTYLKLETGRYMTRVAEAMAKYVRTSKHLQRIHWDGEIWNGFRQPQREEILSCFLSAFQESTSLKELRIDSLYQHVPFNLAFENMLAHSQNLQSLTFSCPQYRGEGIVAVTAATSGLKKNTTLRELTLTVSRGTTISPIFTSLRDHPLLRKICVRGWVTTLTGLETVLLSDSSEITELDIDGSNDNSPTLQGLAQILQALGRQPKLTKLRIRGFRLDHIALSGYDIRSLQSLDLARNHLGSARLAQFAPALYHNTSIKVLDLSENKLIYMESAVILRDILQSNKTITILNLSENQFGETTGAVECIADGLGSNSTLLKIDLSSCALGDNGASMLAQTLGSRNTTLQKLTLDRNFITSTGVGVLLETMEQNGHHITDLSLQNNSFGNEGASLLARSLGNNALPSLRRLSASSCGIDDDGFIALMSALEQNTSLLHLDLRHGNGVNERTFLAIAESLPEIKVLQRVDFSWCTGLASAMPLLLAGLRKNKSLFRFHVANCAPTSAPPTPQDKAKCAGGWVQEMERLGYRNRFLHFINAPKERLPSSGVWPHALARVAILPDVIFEVLLSKPSLVPSEDIEGKEAAIDTAVPKKRKRGDE